MANNRVTVQVGQRFGRGTVVNPSLIVIGKNGRLHYSAQLECDCTNLYTASIYNITSGNTKSCGCLRKERSLEAAGKFNRAKTIPGRSARASVINGYRKSASRKEREWTLREDEFDKLVSSPCFYCGQPPSNVRREKKQGYGDFVYNGLDRQDNTKGYAFDNVVSCCWPCNDAKGTKPLVEFVSWLDRIAEFRTQPRAQGGII